MTSLATPTGLAVAPQGTTGAATHGYKVAALLADGTTTTAATTEVTIANGNATLTATEFNRVSWTAVTGASGYNVFRTTGGATQGKITSTPITAVTLDDTGIAASGSAPTVNGTGSILFATDGGGSIGASGANRPDQIYASGGINAGAYFSSGGYITVANASYVRWGVNRSKILSSADGVFELANQVVTGFTRLNFGGTSNSFPAIAPATATIPNSLSLQSAAGTQTWNDALTAESATVAVRSLLDIATPTLTSTAATVTYTNTTALHVGLPVASTNITFTNPATSILADGPIRAGGYLSSDGTAGATGTCSGYPTVKNGLIVSCAGI